MMKTGQVILVAAVGSVVAAIGWKFGTDTYHWAKEKSKGIKFRLPINSDSNSGIE